MRFRKKPVEIDAIQWFVNGDHPAVVAGWKDADGVVYGAVRPEFNIHGKSKCFAIKTLEGWHEVAPGDWIIRGVKGELYPCKPDIFAATYEVVT